MRTRFAPSPTGYLHLGHALSAILNNAIGTGFLLRIEDIDKDRARPHFQRAIINDLQWLGCLFKEDIIRQQQRMAIYWHYLDLLIKEKWVYPCFCSRKDIAAQALSSTKVSSAKFDKNQQKKRAFLQIEQPVYAGLCKKKSPLQQQQLMSVQSYSWRLDAVRVCDLLPDLFFEDIARGRQTADMSVWGDVVLARMDTNRQLQISYHLACVVDDALQKIDIVVRGNDLYASSIIHCALQGIFSQSDSPQNYISWKTPLYFHHALIKDEKDRKLSKRDHATSLASLRENGVSPLKIRALLAPTLEQNLACYETYFKQSANIRLT